MSGYADMTVAILPASPSFDGIAALYEAVGFRSDLIDDLHLVRRIGGWALVAVEGGQVVGSSSALRLGDTGWIGGVAVLPEFGRRGIGELLTRAACEAMGPGIARVVLFATPMAQPLYERMGFTPMERWLEYHGQSESPRPTRRSGLIGRSEDLVAVVALDRHAIGADRSPLYAERWPSGGRVIVERDMVVGFSMRQAPTCPGPVVATDLEVGQRLLLESIDSASTPQRVAFPESQTAIAERLRNRGFEHRTTVTRMQCGGSYPIETSWIFSAFNLYWG